MRRLWIALAMTSCSASSDGTKPTDDAGTSADAFALEASSLSDAASDAPITCPTAPPFDDDNAALVEKCTRPVLVGVGNGLRRVVSYDAQAWPVDVWFPDGGADQNENSHRNVAVAHGLIVIVGDGGILVSSDGGTSFATPITGRLHDSAVGYFQGAFWVVSSLGTYASSDGVSWTQSTTTELPGNVAPTFSASSIATSGGTLVAIDGRNTRWRTFDGATWVDGAFDAGYGELAAVAYGAGTFALIGAACCDTQSYAGLRAASANGSSWTLITNASPNAASYRFGDIIWDGSEFFATASQYDSRTYVSADGLAWTEHTTNQGMGPVVKFGSTYVGSNGAVIYQSTDGVTWNNIHTATGDAQWGFTAFASGAVLKQ